MKTQLKTKLSIAVAVLAMSPVTFADSIPSVVVTVKNQAPQRGAFQTPVWVGVHNGTFDIYDRNVALGDTGVNPDLISRESVERLAEDGITAPITDEFSDLQPYGSQTTFVAPGGPLQPGSRVSSTLNIGDPTVERFFSYASMIIPSNDAFVANGSPVAHELFNDKGQFIAQDFIVAGNEVLDAGTEINDEISANTAFLNQTAPNTGKEENGVITLSSGFSAPGALTYPNGVLNHPVFANANFTAPGTRTLQFNFRYVDLGGNRVRFIGDLTPEQEVSPELIESPARGRVLLAARNGERVDLSARFNNLSGKPTAAHLHLGPAGVNGPIVANLTSGLRNNRLSFRIQSADVIGPLANAENPFLALLNELAAGNIYLNIHTAANPAGELRGQINLR